MFVRFCLLSCFLSCGLLFFLLSLLRPFEPSCFCYATFSFFLSAVSSLFLSLCKLTVLFVDAAFFFVCIVTEIRLEDAQGCMSISQAEMFLLIDIDDTVSYQIYNEPHCLH